MTYAAAGVSLATAETIVGRLRSAVEPRRRTPARRGRLRRLRGPVRARRRPLSRRLDRRGRDEAHSRAASAAPSAPAAPTSPRTASTTSITSGAEPLFLLDYVAAARRSRREVTEPVEGAAEVCREAGCTSSAARRRSCPASTGRASSTSAARASASSTRGADRRLAGTRRATPSSASRRPVSTRTASRSSGVSRRGGLRRTGSLAPTRLLPRGGAPAPDRADVRAFAHVTGGGIPGTSSACSRRGLARQIDWVPGSARRCSGGSRATSRRTKCDASSTSGSAIAPSCRSGGRRRARDREHRALDRLIGVLVTGRGTNLQALIDAACRWSPWRRSARRAYAARAGPSAGDPGRGVRLGSHPDRNERDLPMADWLEQHGVELVVLRGVHAPPHNPSSPGSPAESSTSPSLLPAFPGARAIEDALAADVETTGVTVHHVDEGLDTVRCSRQEQVRSPRRASRHSTSESTRSSTDCCRRWCGSCSPLPPKCQRARLGVRQDRRRRVRPRLAELGVEIVSTGGTARSSRRRASRSRRSKLTGRAEILGGRVKTLHPAIHGGILARRDDPGDIGDAGRDGIEPIDLVCVNLYPFERASRLDVTEDEVIEKIDIGGPAMIRAAAKNHATSPSSSRPRVRRRARRARATRRDLRRDPPPTWPRRRSRHRPLRRGDRRLVRRARRDVPRHDRLVIERSSTSPTARTRTSAAALLHRGGRAHARARRSRSCTARPLSFNNVLDLAAARGSCARARRAGAA